MAQDVAANGTDSPNERPELFLRLLLSNESRIFSYILRLVPNFADAEEIMQETSGIMWRKFGQFESGTDFVAWAIQIAQYRILDYRRKQYRERRIYDSEIFEQMTALAKASATDDDRRIEALKRCLAKLRERQRRLIRLRYYEGTRPKDIADREGMSVHAVYKSLSRACGQLLSCVRRTLASEG